MTKKKRTRNKTPRRKSERKRNRTSKGTYYDEHFGEGSSGETTIQEDVDVYTNATAQDLMKNTAPVDVIVSPTPINVTTPAKVDVPTGGHGTIVTAGANSSSTSTPSIVPEGNKTFPTIDACSADGLGHVTPVRRVQRSKSLSLKQELESAASFFLGESPLVSNSVGQMFPKSVVNVDTGIVKEIHFDKSSSITYNEENSEYLLDARNVLELYEASCYCRKNVVAREWKELQDHIVESGRKSTDNDNDAVLELSRTIQLEKQIQEEMTRALELETQKNEELNQLLQNEKLRNERLTAQCDNLGKQLFEKMQQQKKADQEIKNLRENNEYRKEVLRLEQIVDDLETDKKNLVVDLQKQQKEIDVVRSSLSDFMTENTVLKNEAKSLKDTITQTEVASRACGIQSNNIDDQVNHNSCSQNKAGIRFGVDFGIDVSVQTDGKVNCKKCGKDEKLIDELIELLAMIESSVAYTQALEDEKNNSFEGKIIPSKNQDWHMPKNRHSRMTTARNSSGNTLNRNKSSTVYASGTAYIPTVQDTSVFHMNRFLPLQHVNNSSLSQPVSSGENIPIKPGPGTYSEVVKGSNKKATIFSTSITKGVDVRDLNKQFTGARAKIHRFHGKKARHFKYYVPAHMGEDKPDTCVIIAGGNDLQDRTPVLQIANDIIDAALTCKNHGATNIIISSVLPREDPTCHSKRDELNQLLFDLCVIHNFVYMDNWNMSSRHICRDGVHLNSSGDSQLLFNLLWYLNDA